MMVLLRLKRGAIGLILIFSAIVIASAQQPAAESALIDRLIGLGKLWAAVKFFHPYLAYRDNINWDDALIKAIPKVDTAGTPLEYSAAIESMLNELGDPATHVLTDPSPATATNAASSTERQPTFRRNPDGVLVVAMTNYADFQDFYGTREKLEALKKELPTATAVVFDLRPERTPSEAEQGMASFAISGSGFAGLISTVSLDMPGERRRMHIGYAPQDGTTSGDYGSGFYLQGRQEKIFAQAHFFLACRGDSCMLRMRTRVIFRCDRRGVNAAARASFP